MSKRTILVTGSIGKQGEAFISSVLSPSKSAFHVLALTRSATSKAAEQLKSRYPEDALTVVEGNLDDEASIRSIFESQNQKLEAIWGVFCVLVFPGLGVDASGEAAQGKMLANLAFEYKVQSFVYSSAMRAGPKYEIELPPKLSGWAKAEVENYCIELGSRGFPWTILRPSLFMENFEDYLGRITYAILKAGLKEDTGINLISAEDIGHVAAAVFNDHSKYNQKILTLAAEQLTTTELNAAHIQAVKKPMPALNSWLAWAILKLNGATQGLIRDLELNHHARKAGEYPEHEAEIALARKAYPMKGYAEWKEKDVAEGEYEGGWNKVSLGKLLTGRM